MKILITGATGFLGTALVERLMRQVPDCELVLVVRPGRRFQVVDATLDAGGHRACLARAVRVRRADLPGAAVVPPEPAPPLPASATK